jgi:hypothetical protein
MEFTLTKCLDTIATQAATLERLFKAQADPEELQTATYEVADSILSKLGLTATGKMSWLDIKPFAYAGTVLPWQYSSTISSTVFFVDSAHFCGDKVPI